MKKLWLVILCAIFLPLQVVTVWRWVHGPVQQRRDPEPRAMMFDEDVPRAIEPSIALKVNDATHAAILSGTPVWLTVGVNNAAAMNEVAAAAALADRLAWPGDSASERARLQAAYEKRRSPAAIGLGDAAHPWTSTVQFLVQDRPLGFAVQLLGEAPGVVALDTVTTAQAEFGSASGAPAGTYAIVACLGASGGWQGRTCSEPAQLTVVERPSQLTREQQAALDRQSARFGLLAGNPKMLDEYGRRLIAADPGSPSGHLYLGEAMFRQSKWDEALQEFTTARSHYDQRHPGAAEQPAFLISRINQVMEKLDTTK